ncbi:MAG: isoprenylcysteine carboxylmethyltransferase family protein [Candidatus Pacearchaeota archaeon]
MMEVSPIGFLALLIYLPILLLSIKKDFRLRFSKINSIKKVDLILEAIAGILYFLIILINFIIVPSQSVLHLITGLIIYFVGLILTYLGYFKFYKSKELITTGIYRYSRNPTYFFGFISLIGIITMTQSFYQVPLLVFLILITHKIILNEEKFLEKKYKKEYLNYKSKIRRYI